MLFDRVDSQPESTRKSSRAEEAVARTSLYSGFNGVFSIELCSSFGHAEIGVV
jgi:hypothetical protein